MQPPSLRLGAFYFQCRRSATTPWISITKRYRSTKNSKPATPGVWSNQRAPWSRPSVHIHQNTYPPIDPLNPTSSFFESNVSRWSTHPQSSSRLALYGVPSQDIPALLNAFTSAVQAKELSSPELEDYYTLSRLAHVQSHDSDREIDIIYSTTFFAWVSHPSSTPRLSTIPQKTTDHILQLAQAADRSFLHEEYPAARKMHRKVIMHVGPTNSGKTHHALRALAASKRGVYAGPLRLLAHEVWERLNLGQIVPLGMDEPPIMPTPTPTATDDAPSPHARVCNMITGEEQKIISPDAPLLSCTVEMLNFNTRYQVAVVDEIQMIADPQRGSGWTSAVLGLLAEELHLCGEETAVPVVQALLKDTGDEVIIRRYQRLTPLRVEERSLEGDLGRVEKGDCIVTFKRSSIFAIKKEVERKTGMRCAVVYGRLPPEIRSEQAALFNDPGSGYDVMVGSDAIGMGLNLKIRRIIFESLTKYSAGAFQPLSTSQIKQIAGRAGRYGQHLSSPSSSSSSSAKEHCGYATTLHTPDLPLLSTALSKPFKPVHHAHVTFSSTTFAALRSLLPPPAAGSTKTVLGAHAYIGRLPRFVRYTYDAQVDQACECVDLYGGGMTVRERLKHLSAPVGWRDEVMIGVMARFLGMYKDRQEVDYWEAIRDLGFMDVLEGVEGAMRGDGDPTNPVLSTLESFHKTAVMYIWLSYRMPVVYAQQEVVVGVKRRVEGALEWCLEGMTMGRTEGGENKEKEKEKKVDITMRLRALVLERQGTKDKVKGMDT
ncbi:hypothetical protein K443DRAFT_98809 [Laccaria amethystina LaAM-08-1]|uniref:RNA helicase n=1 Tax=Laccaria amethystina LaAM-08-1 TaxID=1095629 RepID=A0A0C9XUD0_9AGAR|nr:hypothetical protein K443DRAFT_98809 [Laccaria amethystina LaAM-08-1]